LLLIVGNLKVRVWLGLRHNYYTKFRENLQIGSRVGRWIDRHVELRDIRLFSLRTWISLDYVIIIITLSSTYVRGFLSPGTSPEPVVHPTT